MRILSRTQSINFLWSNFVTWWAMLSDMCSVERIFFSEDEQVATWVKMHHNFIFCAMLWFIGKGIKQDLLQAFPTLFIWVLRVIVSQSDGGRRQRTLNNTKTLINALLAKSKQNLGAYQKYKRNYKFLTVINISDSNPYSGVELRPWTF